MAKFDFITHHKLVILETLKQWDDKIEHLRTITTPDSRPAFKYAPNGGMGWEGSGLIVFEVRGKKYNFLSTFDFRSYFVHVHSFETMTPGTVSDQRGRF